jgi:hypothetical protein
VTRTIIGCARFNSPAEPAAESLLFILIGGRAVDQPGWAEEIAQHEGLT